jgi:hypothetical protein
LFDNKDVAKNNERQKPIRHCFIGVAGRKSRFSNAKFQGFQGFQIPDFKPLESLESEI